MSSVDSVLGQELAPWDVKVVVIEPGTIHTETAGQRPARSARPKAQRRYGAPATGH